ncbi:DNA binding protein [Arthrobacter phage Sporto]|nr:DNA binding protein [Arthrobacter phage Sporto]
MTEGTFLGEERAIFHIGTKQHSGRYPWGSGENPGQRNKSFLMYVDDLKKKGFSDKEISEGLGLSLKQFRDNKSIAKHEIKQDLISRATKLKEQGNSNAVIAEKLDMANESSVRALLSERTKEKVEKMETLSNTVKAAVDEKGMVDIGQGVPSQLGVSAERLSAAVTKLQSEGYNVYGFQVDQMNGKKTNMKVLAKPDVPYKEVYTKPENISQIMAFTSNQGKSFDQIQPPLNIDLKRVGVRYGPDGGAEMDGVIHVRRGVEDISLGQSRYAQVRIGVEGTHYLKGMAIYSDDLPKGVDLMFNTNKTDTGNKLDAMKPQKIDKETGTVDQSNPFGSIVRQQFAKDANGNDIVDKKGNKKVSSAMNIVYEEGDWDKWSKSIASQVLSKQSTPLAKRQLGLRYDEKRAEYDEIMALTNPAIKRKLLNSLADDLDSSAVHLKAAALPRQRTQVILPSSKLKDDEIYAPNFNNGEKVMLIRYPHGGLFEIPELTVNNRSRPAIEPIKGAKDAVMINHKVAERLSGADFDGDTVLVIPNNSRALKNKAALPELKGFDAKGQYALPEGVDGIRGMKNPSGMTQRLMGDISNLITDMTVMKAEDHELARAVKHSMVVIDAQKHNLNYKQSAKDNQISELKAKYQGGPRAGAATLISKSTSDARVVKRKQWNPSAKTIDTDGSKIRSVADDAMLKDREGNPLRDSKGNIRYKTENSTKMAETKDAMTLVSNKGHGQPIEIEYALHANKLKAMANEARKSWVNTPPQSFNASARRAYQPEVKSLDDKLDLVLRNKPLERQAQVFANVTIKAKLQANPDMDKAELKKLKTLALNEARNRVNAKKSRIQLTPMEWNAIQAGAISNHKLEQILDNMDDKDIKALATPRERPAMLPSKVDRAKNMLNADFTRAEVAEALGVSVTTLNNVLEEGS